MLGKLLVSASFATLLIVAPAVAQDQGQGGQNNPVILKRQGQEQNAGEAARAKQQPDQTQATGDQDQGQIKKKKVQQSRDATDEQPASEAQATGQENQGNKKKKVQQNTQTEQGGKAKKQDK